MAGKINKAREPRRDREDKAMLKHMGDPAHINGEEARLLAHAMPESHGKVIASGLLAEAGRRGDDRVTLLTDREAALLKRQGGAGTRNPKSGLLEFYGGTSGGGGGEGGDNGVGGPGNGSAGTGPGQGDAGSMGVGGNTSFSDNYGIGWGGVESDIGGGGLGGNTGFGGWADDPSMRADAPEDAITDHAGAVNWNEYNFNGYKPAGTWGRFFQELWSPSVPTSKYGATTGRNLGIMGGMAGFLTGGPMSMAMNVGQAMGRASTPAEQAASAAEDAGRSAHNSTGQDRDSSTGLSLNDMMARAPGARSGSVASGLLDDAAQLGTAPGVPGAPGGGMVVPGAVGPTNATYQGSDRTLTGLPTPMQNLLADYLFRGRQGSGFNW